MLERFDAAHSDVPRVIPTIWPHEPRAIVALARGNPELARAEAFEQRDQLHAVGVDPPTISWRAPAVRALLLGEALRVAGRRSEAREPPHRGIDLATECGSIALRTRAVAALEALGDRPRKLMFAGVQALTASERRVADLAVTGRANREIAQELFVTPKTVENHLGRIYTKLGINGRREFARALS